MLRWIKNTYRLACAAQECRHAEERYYSAHQKAHTSAAARCNEIEAYIQMLEARDKLAEARRACK